MTDVFDNLCRSHLQSQVVVLVSGDAGTLMTLVSGSLALL